MAVKGAVRDKMVKGAPREKSGTSAVDKAASAKAGEAEAEAKAKIEEEEAQARKARLIKAALGKRYARTFKIAGEGPDLSAEEIAARDEAWSE